MTPGHLAGTSLFYSFKSCRAFLEAACGTSEPSGRRAHALCWDTSHTPHALLKLPLLGLLFPQTPISLTLKLWDVYILERV